MHPRTVGPSGARAKRDGDDVVEARDEAVPGVRPDRGPPGRRYRGRMTAPSPGPEGLPARQVAVWVAVATGAWAAESAVYTIQLVVFGSPTGGPVDLPLAVAQSLVSALLWVPFTVMALWLAFRWPVTVDRRNVLVHIAGFAVLVLGRVLAAVVLNPALRWYPDGVPPWDRLLLIGVLNNLVVYVLMTGLAHAVFYHRAVRRAEARFAAARFGALSSQLQPHFLFNALNTIAALIPTRPEVAERMVVDLSALLRFSVARDTAALIPLEEEVEIGRAYLRIEEHRFADRLRVRVDVADAVRRAAVPPFLLQPLLENAVRHGLAPRTGHSTLEVRAVRDGDRVRITVRDDGVGLRPDRRDEPPGEDGTAPDPGGVGLTHVRERLREAYGVAAQLELAGREPTGVQVDIVVPFRAVDPATARR